MADRILDALVGLAALAMIAYAVVRFGGLGESQIRAIERLF